MNDRLLKVIVIAVMTLVSWCIIFAASYGLVWLIGRVLDAIGV